MSIDFDCLVIGSGPGYVAAIGAAQLGMTTAVVERDDVVGGRCLNHACIPAKAVLRSADILWELRGASEVGISTNGIRPEVDFGAIMSRRETVIRTLTAGVRALMKTHNIEIIRGEGSLTTDGHVKVRDTVYTASRAVVLATGTRRRALPDLAYGGNVIGTRRPGRSGSCPRRWW
jgi:dihydrolipoamide dehydrogenase